MRARFGLTLVLAVGVLLLAVTPAAAKSVDTTVDFALDTWIDLGFEDGPVVLHRIRLSPQSGPLTKSKLIRPFSSEYLQEIQIQLEFSNSSTRDWEADLLVEWLDEDGKVIDGYNDDENLDDNESRDLVTVTMPTLKYGLARAKKLRLRISVHPD